MSARNEGEVRLPGPLPGGSALRTSGRRAPAGMDRGDQRVRCASGTAGAGMVPERGALSVACGARSPRGRAFGRCCQWELISTSWGRRHSGRFCGSFRRNKASGGKAERTIPQSLRGSLPQSAALTAPSSEGAGEQATARVAPTVGSYRNAECRCGSGI